ncbi:MAG: hypothetical protein WA055_04770 [Candidatus Moraniibacteriota bacterium]
MRSIRRRYENITKKNPIQSSYVSFVEAIKGQGFCYKQIKKWFSELVDEEDYARREKGAILRSLKSL